MSQNEVINKIRNYIEVLKANGIDVYKTFLYGSYSRNEANKDSDIDILLVLNTNKNDDITLARPWLFTRNVDSRIEPYVINKEIFFKADTSPLMEAITKEGIEIN